MTIMQGDSYPIYIELAQDGKVLTPDMVAELEICIGDNDKEVLRKLLSTGDIAFAPDTNRWYFRPTQAETLAIPKGRYNVHARIRYKNAGMEDVVGVRLDSVQVDDGISGAVI